MSAADPFASGPKTDATAGAGLADAQLAALGTVQRSFNSSALRPGDPIGPYVFERKLGFGASSVVYQVRDPRDGNSYALKLLNPAPESQREEVFRFKREFRAMARLRHRNLVAVHASGVIASEQTLDGERPYLLMELVRGRTLADDLPRLQALPMGERLGEAVRIAVEVCAALGYIHSRRVVHRDVKPGNVMVEPGGGVKLMDFGVARVLDDPGRITQAGAFVGTLAYISPEQALGHRVDARTDLYAVGVILYELLTGHRPFVADDPIAFLYLHAKEPPRPPRELEPTIPPSLERVILRLLAKQPEQRYPDGDAAAAAMAAALEPTPELVNATGPIATGDLLARRELARAERTGIVLLQAPLVGRDSALEQLRASLSAAEQGRGGRVSIVGQPGMGKSRLVETLTGDARTAGATVLVGRAVQRGGHAYGALRPLVEQAMHALRRRARRAAEPRAAAVIVEHLVPVVEAAFPGVDSDRSAEGSGPHTGASLVYGSEDPRQARRRVTAAVRAVFDRLLTLEAGGEPPPLVVVVEDCHWSDPDERAALAAVATTFERDGRRALLITTTTPHGADTRGGAVVELLPLQTREVGEMARGILGREQVPAAFAERLHRLTGGNPLLVEETLRFVMQSGAVTPDASLEELRLPDSARALVRRRIEATTPMQRRLLDAVAVLGAPFTFALVRDILAKVERGHAPAASPEATLDPADSSGEDALLDAVDALVRSELLEELPAGPAAAAGSGPISAGGRFSLAHAGLEEVLYGDIPPERRIQLHAAAAEALETHSRGPGGSAVKAIAHHFVEGKRHARAAEYLLAAAERWTAEGGLRPEVLRDVERAERLLRVAGAGLDDPRLRRAACLRSLAHLRADELDEAERWNERYRELAVAAGDREPVDRACWLHTRGSIALVRGEPDRAVRDFERAAELCDQVGEAVLAAQARLGLGSIYTRRGELGRAARVFQDVLASPSAQRSVTVRARAEGALATVQFFTCDLEASARRATLSADLSRAVGATDRAVSALVVGGCAEALRGRYDAALQAARDAVDLARQAGERFRLGEALQTLSEIYLEVGWFDRAAAVIDPAVDSMAAAELRVARAYPAIDFATDLVVGRLRLAQGRTDAAVSVLEEALRKGEAQGASGYLALACSYLGQALTAGGRARDAVVLAARALRAVQGGENVLGVVEAHLTAAEAALGLQEPERAARYARAAEKLAAKHEMRPHAVRALALWARAARIAGQSVAESRLMARGRSVVAAVLAGLGPDTAAAWRARPEVALFADAPARSARPRGSGASSGARSGATSGADSAPSGVESAPSGVATGVLAIPGAGGGSGPGAGADAARVTPGAATGDGDSGASDAPAGAVRPAGSGDRRLASPRPAPSPDITAVLAELPHAHGDASGPTGSLTTPIPLEFASVTGAHSAPNSEPS